MRCARGLGILGELLVDAVLRLATQRYKGKGRDPMMIEQTQPTTLGTQEPPRSRFALFALPPQRVHCVPPPAHGAGIRPLDIIIEASN